MFGLFRKKGKEDVSKAVYKAAVTPRVVNPKAVSFKIRPIIEAYIKAIYSQDSSILPSRMMRDEIYASTVDSIKEDKKLCQRTCSTVTLNQIAASDYDSTTLYTVRSIEFTCIFNVKGTCNGMIVDEKRRAVFTFINDQRQGWSLDDWQDLGSVDN